MNKQLSFEGKFQQRFEKKLEVLGVIPSSEDDV